MATAKSLTCKDCSASFIWSESDQEFFAEKGYSQPIRCQDCRQVRKRERGEAGPARVMYDAYCQKGDHTIKVPFQIDTSRPWVCQEDRNKAKSEREASLKDAFCSSCQQTIRVPFQIDPSRPWHCRDCKGASGAPRSGGPPPRKEIYCDKGSHMVNVPLSFIKDDSRPWTCRDCRESGLGLTMRSDRRGDFSGSSQRSSLPGLQFHHDRRGDFSGSSQRVPGMDLTFHSGRDGKYNGRSERVEGLGLTFNYDKKGKLKSTTDRNGFRTGRDGGFRGSSRRF